MYPALQVSAAGRMQEATGSGRVSASSRLLASSGPPSRGLCFRQRLASSRVVTARGLRGGRHEGRLTSQRGGRSRSEALPEYLKRPERTPSVAPPPPPPPPPSTSWPSFPAYAWAALGFATLTLVIKSVPFFRDARANLQRMAMEAAMKQMLKPLSPPRHQSGGFNSPFDGMPSGASLDSFPSSGGFDFQQALSQAMQGPGRSTAGPVIDAQVSAQETRSVETAPAASASTPTAAPAPTPPLPPPPSSPPPVKPAFAFEDVRPDPLKERRRAAAAPAAGEDSAASTSAPVEGSSGPARELPSADAVLDMLRNPDLQKMLYPHLPEGMRSPETFELMLKDPTMREQLKKVAEEQIKNFQGASGGRLPPDFPGIDPAAVQKQFSAMGLTPEVFMKKISSDPELSMLMMKPAVMSALVEIQSDPRAMHKYQNNPDIMKIFTKLQVMFPQLGGTAR